MQSIIFVSSYSHAVHHIHMQSIIFTCSPSYSHAVHHIHMQSIIFTCSPSYSYAVHHIHMQSIIFVSSYSFHHIRFIIFVSSYSFHHIRFVEKQTGNTEMSYRYSWGLPHFLERMLGIWILTFFLYSVVSRFFGMLVLSCSSLLWYASVACIMD